MMFDYTPFALQFFSGKYEGSVYPLPKNKTISVGRGAELELILIEDMVSRFHAKFICSEKDVLLQDHNSTNGTFVNGERIQQTSLKNNDRILIGTVILQVIPLTQEVLKSYQSNFDSSQDFGTEDPSYVTIPPKESKQTRMLEGLQESHLPLPQFESRAETKSKPSLTLSKFEKKLFSDTVEKESEQEESLSYSEQYDVIAMMTGSLDETPLQELLELLVNTRKSGVLLLQTSSSEGRLHLQQGLILSVKLNGKTPLDLKETARRILAWKKADFAFFPPNDQDMEAQTQESALSLLEEAHQFEKKVKSIRKAIPSTVTQFTIPCPIVPSLSELPDEYLSLFQLVWNQKEYERILLESLLDEVEILQKLAYLVRHEYIKPQ